MAKVLGTEEYYCSLYDTVTNEDCTTDKVVDVTEDCPRASEEKRFILLFTHDSNGSIVQIIRPYKGEKQTGVCLHFYINKLEAEIATAPQDDPFGSWVAKTGLDKMAFLELIKKHMPEI